MAYDFRARGLRTPLHTALITCLPNRLYPFMAAPLRPNETLVGLRVTGGSWFNRLVKVGFHVPIGIEIGIWKVPLSALGDEFRDLVIHDAEDAAVQGSFTVQSARTVRAPGPVAEQGHLDGTPLGTKGRQWAGEIGMGLNTPQGGGDARYARWVSASTWEIGRTFYDLEMGDNAQLDNAHRDSFTLHDDPPKISDMIRGATYSGVTAADHPDAVPQTAPWSQSVSAWAEILSLMVKPDQTYREYLESFGVNPNRVDSIPEPIVYKRMMLQERGGTQSWHMGGNYISEDQGNTLGDVEDYQRRIIAYAGEYDDDLGNYVRDMEPTVSTTTEDFGTTFAGDAVGVMRLGRNYRIKRKRRILADEPSVLLGCFAWSPMMYLDSQFVHHLDMSQMMHAAHWGVPFGGIDEADFLQANELRDRTGAAPQIPHDAVEPGIRAFNMLNLYLNGDSFVNVGDRFGWYGPMDTYDESINLATRFVDSNLMTQLAIATDMVM
jgi:hypothetical protein